MGKPRHIAVIGGGIAGLGAADELARRGHAVTVLEAKPSFGGRIHTVAAGLCPIELGAEFLHGESQTLLKLIREARLSTHTVPDRHQLLEGGQCHDVPIWDVVGDVIHQVNLQRPDQSFQDFARTLDPFQRRVSTAFVEGFHAAQPELISVHALLKGELAAEEMNGGRHGRINQGYSALVQFLEQRIRRSGGTLHNGAVVREVKWRAGQVELLFQGGHKLAADAAVITVPLGVLKAGALRFDPPLDAKKSAVDRLQFGNVMKIALCFDAVWWPEQDFGFVHAFDQLIPTWWSNPLGAVLTGWAGGIKADKLRMLDAARLEELALDILSHIFSASRSEVRSKLRTAYRYDWAGDPHIRGAYSYIPVDGLDLPNVLAQPVEQTLFFAGEATVNDAQTGTVFGALETGLRAAREALRG